MINLYVMGNIVDNLLVLSFTETSNRTTNSDGGSSADLPCTSCNNLTTRTTVPYTNCLALQSHLSAEYACVSGMLRDVHLLNCLTEGSTITGPIFTYNSCLLGALGHVDVAKIIICTISLAFN